MTEKLEKTKYQQALEFIQKSAEQWDNYAIYNLIKDAKIKGDYKCPDMITYDELLNQILAIYGIDKNS